MTVYYLDSNAAPGGDGLTEATAWDALGDVSLSADDTLRVARASSFTGSLAVTVSGVQIEAYGSGALPVIDGNDAGHGVEMNNLSGWGFEYLAITNTRRNGLSLPTSGAGGNDGYIGHCHLYDIFPATDNGLAIRLRGDRHVIEYTLIDGSNNDGINVGDGFYGGNDGVIRYTTVLRAGANSATEDADCLHMSELNARWNIYANLFDHSDNAEKQALLLKGDDNLVYDNILKFEINPGVANACVWMGGADDGNGAGGHRFLRNLVEGGGVGLRCGAKNTLIVGCPIQDADTAGATFLSGANAGTGVYQCTLVGALTGDGIEQPQGAAGASWNAFNNICAFNGAYGIVLAAITGYDEGYNCLYGNGTAARSVPAGANGDASDILVDPEFRDYAGRDLRLHATSPCIGAGIDWWTALGEDAPIGHDGLRFMDPPSMGAYEVRPDKSTYARACGALPTRVLPAGVDVCKARAA